MRPLSPEYQEAISGWRRVPSAFILALPKGAERPDLRGSLEAAALPGLATSIEGNAAHASVRLADVEDRTEHTFWLSVVPAFFREPSLPLELTAMTKPQSDALRESEWGLAIEVELADSPLRELQRVAQLGCALSPGVAGMLDPGALAFRSGDWVRDVAGSSVPPSPLNLFSIHQVQAKDGRIWLHTHGLARAGGLELEALGVRAQGAGAAADVLNAIAAMFLDQGIPPPDQPFSPGSGLELTWLPWEDALRKVPRGSLGGAGDRDEGHRAPSAALFVAARRLFKSRYLDLGAAADALAANPVLYVSDAETLRAARLARERLSHFRKLLELHGADGDWQFVVKLGYPTRAGGEEQREHLWFEVHGFAGGEIDGTLMNEPYDVPELKRGARGLHPVDRMTDFLILCPRGRFDPGRVLDLVRPGAAPAELN